MFKCDRCGKRHTYLPSTCDFCGKSFEEYSKMVECDGCGKIILSDRPTKCPYCGKKFGNRFQLNKVVLDDQGIRKVED